MKKFRIIQLLAACAAIFTAVLSAQHRPASRAAAEPSLRTVLEAHGVYQKPGVFSAYVSDAVRLTSIDGGAELPGFFERRITVSCLGASFKVHRTDPAEIKQRAELFDGQSFVYGEIEAGRKTLGGGQKGSTELTEAKFAVETFGLMPILKRLSDPATHSVYERPTPAGNRFKVAGAGGDWAFCSDRKRLIRRVEIGNARIEYADYRAVDGIQLPFTQKVWIRNRLVYELVFSKIDLKPLFQAGSFTREQFMN